MLRLDDGDTRSVALTTAIRTGDVEALRRLLGEDPQLATARIVDDRGVERTLLHVAADWPGHTPGGARIVGALIAAGADVDATVIQSGPCASAETALHWAASSDDVAVLDSLLDAGADIEAPGAVFTGGTPMSDAVVFAQWRAARRLVERGAATTLWQAAALGLLERVQAAMARQPPPSAADLTNALWHACRGGHPAVAARLLEAGGDPAWVGYDGKTSLDVAIESGNDALVGTLRDHDAAP